MRSLSSTSKGAIPQSLSLISKVRIGLFSVVIYGTNTTTESISSTTTASMPTISTSSKRYGKLKEERALFWAKIMVVAGASTILLAVVGITASFIAL